MGNKKDNFWCILFGHQFTLTKAYGRYFRKEKGAIDGIGRQHVQLYTDCERCDKKIHIGSIHADENGNIF